MKKMNKKGFTIVELVIVIAVIGILAAVLVPTFSNVISKANDSAALQEARNAYTAYLADHAQAGNADADYVKIGEVYYDVNDGYKVVVPSNTEAGYTYIVVDDDATCECGYELVTVAKAS